MKKNKGRLDLLRDRVEDLSIASRRYQSLIYFVWFVFVVVTYGLMIGLNLFLSEEVEISSTKLQSELDFGSTAYVLLDRNVNQKERSATFVLGKNEMDPVYEERTWHVSVDYQNGSDDGQIQTTIYQGENNFTYIQVEGLASEWSGLRVELTTKSDVQVEEQSDYIIVGEKDTQSDPIDFQNETEVEITAIDYAIEQRNAAIADNETVIKENEEEIEKNKEKSQLLEAEMVYQTDAQKTETQNSINQLNERNRQLATTNYSTEKQNEELQEQIEKLQEKVADKKNSTK